MKLGPLLIQFGTNASTAGVRPEIEDSMDPKPVSFFFPWIRKLTKEPVPTRSW
jgi:hypothetical protein